MHRIRATKVFPHILASSNKSFTTSSSHIIPQIPNKSCLAPFLPLSQAFSRKDQTTNIQHPIKLKSITTSSLALARESMADNETRLLCSVDDVHGGVGVDIKEPMNQEDFASLLRASMSQWRLQEKKGVWLKLPIEHSNLVHIAVKEGFKYHHAEPDYLMLVNWIPDTPNTLPLNASHRVGIGAFVMNDNKEVLVVQEKNGKFKGSGIWKYPTGVINEGEDISTAAIREVKEETGIDTKFVEVLAFRQSHQSFFTKSDLFFVCVLKPQSFIIEKQAAEIDEAKWMPVKEYAAQPFVQKHELFKLVADICAANAESGYTGFRPFATTTASGKTSHLYFNRDSANGLLVSNEHPKNVDENRGKSS